MYISFPFLPRAQPKELEKLLSGPVLAQCAKPWIRAPQLNTFEECGHCLDGCGAHL